MVKAYILEELDSFSYKGDLSFFDIEDIESFYSNCFNRDLFGAKKTLVFKRAEDIKDLSFIEKILPEKDVVLEFRKSTKTIENKLAKLGVEVEKRVKEDFTKKLVDKFGKEAASLKIDNINEYNKLEMLFLNREFSIKEAEDILINNLSYGIFDALDDLMKGKTESSLKYIENGDGMAFIMALKSLFNTVAKVKVLDLKGVNYSSFKSGEYEKYKDLLPHPYYTFKNIKVAKKYNLKRIYDISKRISEIEEMVREGLNKEQAATLLLKEF